MERLLLKSLKSEYIDPTYGAFSDLAVSRYLLDEPPATACAQAEDIVRDSDSLCDMPQPVALFDIDGTLTTDNVWNGIMSYSAGRSDTLRHLVTHAAFVGLNYPMLIPRALGLLSETSFRRIWGQRLAWYFRGFDDEQMTAMTHWVAYTATAPMVRQDVLSRLRGHVEDGLPVALVSGAPMPFVTALAGMWGVPHAIGSPVEFRDGHYTGRLTGPPCVDAQKATYTRAYFVENAIPVDYASSFAYADSYSDLGLFELVGHPVAVYPDRALKGLAEQRGWEILGHAKDG
jgi:HAD superfamily hydrolase (TIGR01490 family)